MIDVLFITRTSRPKESAGGDILRALWLQVQGEIASIPYVRQLVRNAGGIENGLSIEKRVKPWSYPVLTPIYLEEFFRRRDITMKEIPSLEDNVDLVRECLRNGVHVIAICTTWFRGIRAADEIRKAATRLSSMAPGVPLVAGGIGVRKALRLRDLLNQGKLTGIFPVWLSQYFLPKKVSYYFLKKALAQHFLLINSQADQSLDAIITGDGGESTLASIVERLKKGKDFRDLPNLAIPGNDNYYFTPYLSESVNIDAEIVDWERYISRLNGHEVPVRCGTGCPFKCGFCDFQGMQKLHFRSIESLISELRILAVHLPPPRRVFFIDDNLGTNRKRIVDFTRAVISENLGLSWRAFMRADIIDAEVATLLRESGCYEVLLGIESGDPEILQNMNKHLDPEQAISSIEALDKVGIRTLTSFVVGFPGESARSIERTASFISAFPSGDKAGAFHRYYLFKFLVSPLSPVASTEQRKKFGLRGIAEKWAHKTMGSAEASEAVRDIFLKVEGPSHFYMEELPLDWHLADIRKVIEIRDVVQKHRMRSQKDEGIDKLLTAVKKAEMRSGSPIQ